MFNDFKFHEIPVAGPPDTHIYERANSKQIVRNLTTINLVIWLLWAILFFLWFECCVMINHGSPPMSVDLMWKLFTITFIANMALLIGTIVCTSLVISYVDRDELSSLWSIANVLPMLVIFLLSLMMIMFYWEGPIP